ncbi:MAG TPA: hypothetical protein VGO58_04655 [Chitinophagaceae bacterium]|jgi:hypothetical protein|nr:hypothetical protein [Chitinophagaceae bacterium]
MKRKLTLKSIGQKKAMQVLGGAPPTNTNPAIFMFDSDQDETGTVGRYHTTCTRIPHTNPARFRCRQYAD